MKYFRISFITPFFILLLFSLHGRAQDNSTDDNNNTVTGLESMKGFHIGFYAGALFANNYSTEIYNGRGLDYNGNYNTFENSLMYRKIILENGGANGLPDNITPQLGPNVNRQDWTFDSSDMPEGLKYATAFQFGICSNYGLNRKEAIIFNMNFAKLTVTGDFTISILRPPSYYHPLAYDSIAYFFLKGSEQRINFQLGYSRIFTDNDVFNFFIEGGLCANNARYVSDNIIINNLTLDLTTYYNSGGTALIADQAYTGWGLGAFGGIGMNVTAGSKYIVQVVYNPSYEKINLGPDAAAKVNHSAGMRVYYSF